jgi:hypothetical protein
MGYQVVIGSGHMQITIKREIADQTLFWPERAKPADVMRGKKAEDHCTLWVEQTNRCQSSRTQGVWLPMQKTPSHRIQHT